MTIEHSQWKDTIVHLLALAGRLEGEGQYNLAKLMRASVDSISRRAAYATPVPADRDTLVTDIERTIDALAGFKVEEGLVAALRRGAAAMAQGRLALINETPHPYVCRTCGHLTLGEPSANCPVCGARPSSYQRFLPVYWLDALEPFAALEKLRQTPLDVAALLAGMSEEAMNQPPTGGGWSIRNAVSHLRDAQTVLDFRIDLFIKDPHPALESKAVFAWATNETQRPPTTREVFESYQASRAESLRKLESIPLADWWRSGEDEEFGTVTLRQQVSYFAAHEITHLPQLQALRGS